MAMGTEPADVVLYASFSKNRRQNIAKMSETLRKSRLAGEFLEFERIATSPTENRRARDEGVHPLERAATKVGAKIVWVK